MPLNCVTITGADDSTDPHDLFELWEAFPFVEYGILIGSSVKPRFPSVEWIHKLIEQREKSNKLMRLSLHVCGKYMRELEAGGSSLGDVLGYDMYAFRRVQLNCNGHRKSWQDAENVQIALCKLNGGAVKWNPTVIFQWGNEMDSFYKPTSQHFDCAGLFDGSGGRGVSPISWPDATITAPCGWAGGLGPDNLGVELVRIHSKINDLRNFWVDMESKVRTDDPNRTMLDMRKVEQCLEIAEPFIEAGIIAGLKGKNARD